MGGPPKSFEWRLSLFDGEPLSFLSAAAALPSRLAAMKARRHPDPDSTLANEQSNPKGLPGMIAFVYYGTDATEDNLQRWYQMSQAMGGIPVLVVMVVYRLPLAFAYT